MYCILYVLLVCIALTSNVQAPRRGERHDHKCCVLSFDRIILRDRNISHDSVIEIELFYWTTKPRDFIIQSYYWTAKPHNHVFLLF